MKKRPLSVIVIALCYLLAPVGNILQIAWFNHWPLTGPRSVFFHLSAYEWTILACFPVVAFGIYKVTRWGYFLFLGFSAFLIMHNSYSFLVNPSYNTNLVILFQLLIVGIVGFFLQKHMVASYFNPQMRWWERDTRYAVSLVAKIDSQHLKAECMIQDISKGGCFISTKMTLKLGETFKLSIDLTDIRFRGTGRVVWVSHKEPVGFGIMFTNKSRDNTRSLNTLINALRHTHGAIKSETKQNLSHTA